MNAFKRRAEKHRIRAQIEMVTKRTKAENIKKMNRRQLINIVSKSWQGVDEEIILKTFQLTGAYGKRNNHFMNHQRNLKERLNK